MKVEQGATRIVFVFKKIVIKIPNFTYNWMCFLNGLIANMRENETWKWNSGKYEQGFSEYLCPVDWCSWGGWFLMMKRAEPLGWEDEDKYYITDHIEHFPGDDKITNYGLLNGKVVKFDYGH